MLNNFEQKEYDIIYHNAAVINPQYFNATTTKKIAKELLLLTMVFNHGEIYQFKAKSRGLGVYEMTLVKKEISQQK